MSAEDVFELEQRRIHEDLTKELRRQLADEQRRREEEQRLRELASRERDDEARLRIAAEQELERLRKLLEERGGC